MLHSPNGKMSRICRKQWAPLLISIAPPCARATSFIESLQENVQTICFPLHQECEEKDLIADVLRGVIDLSTFSEKLPPLVDHDTRVIDLVLKVIEHVLNQHDVVSDHPMLQTRDAHAAFPIQHHEEKSMDEALEQIKYQLKHNPGVICWKPTMISPDAYRPVLALAVKYRRIVRFIRWGQELPCVSLIELYLRNVMRFLSCGIYIKSTLLTHLYDEAEDFLLQAQPYSRKRTHTDLANLAGFQMDSRGHVYPAGIALRPQSPADQSYMWRSWTDRGIISCLRTNAHSQRTVRFHFEEDSNLDVQSSIDIPHLESISTELCSHSVSLTPAPSPAEKLCLEIPDDHVTNPLMSGKLTFSVVSPTSCEMEYMTMKSVSTHSDDGYGLTKRYLTPNRPSNPLDAMSHKPHNSIECSRSNSSECALS